MLDVVTKEITELRLRTLAPGTIVVLAFDADAGNIDILSKNIKKLKLRTPKKPNFLADFAK